MLKGKSLTDLTWGRLLLKSHSLKGITDQLDFLQSQNVCSVTENNDNWWSKYSKEDCLGSFESLLEYVLIIQDKTNQLEVRRQGEPETEETQYQR